MIVNNCDGAVDNVPSDVMAKPAGITTLFTALRSRRCSRRMVVAHRDGAVGIRRSRLANLVVDGIDRRAQLDDVQSFDRHAVQSRICERRAAEAGQAAHGVDGGAQLGDVRRLD